LGKREGVPHAPEPSAGGVETAAACGRGLDSRTEEGRFPGMSRKSLTERRAEDLARFLEEVKQLPERRGGGPGRLIFALDATASREPTWDRAARVTGEMFLEAGRLGGLEVQLVFYRGFDECKASRWVAEPRTLVDLMTRVTCRAGQTQIRRVLRHALKETGKERVHALVFIGDCCEEDIDGLGRLAGELGLRGVRAFMFQEGADPVATRAFRDIARLTGGAHCRFDSAAPGQLRDLLAAVATYAAGGMAALESYAGRSGHEVRLIARQIR